MWNTTTNPLNRQAVIQISYNNVSNCAIKQRVFISNMLYKLSNITHFIYGKHF